MMPFWSAARGYVRNLNRSTDVSPAEILVAGEERHPLYSTPSAAVRLLAADFPQYVFAHKQGRITRHAQGDRV